MTIMIDFRIPKLRVVNFRTTFEPSSPAKRQTNTPSVIADPGSRLVWQRFIHRKKPPRDRYLPSPPFPAEIWLQIINDCRDDLKLLLALTKTCSFFKQISQPCLYEAVAVELCRPPASRFRILRPQRPVSLFERSLKNRPDLGTFVRSLTLLGAVHLLEYPQVLSKLDQFPNLETLRLQRLRIDADLCHSLHRHPRLTTVEFNHCKLHQSLAHAHSNDFSGSPISKLIILYPVYSHPDPADLWDTLVPVRLRSLELKEYDLLYRSVDSMLPIMTTSGKTQWLETLIVNNIPTSIVQFLISSPQLRHLSIKCTIGPDIVLSFSSFPADAVPLLEHYGGPVELLEIFLPNRPVHRVSLGFSDFPTDIDDIDILTVLQLPSVPVTELEIWYPENWYPEVGHLMWLVPITIHQFTFHYLDFWGLNKWLSALSRFTDLLTIRCPRYWQYMGKEIVMEISNVCPSLRELDLMYKRWVMVRLNEWECISKN